MSVDRINSAHARPLDAKVRMADLARLAGVSIATVSRSLKDSPLINRATKTRIWRIASAQGYITSGEAAGLPGLGRPTVAVMLPMDGGARLHPLVGGLIAAARDLRCNLMVSPFGRKGDVAGAVATTPADAYVFFDDAVARSGLNDLAGDDEARFVVWGTGQANSAYPSFGPDNFAAGVLATRCLVERGCRRIAYLCGPDHHEATQRFMGYLTGLSSAGLAVDPALILTEPPTDGLSFGPASSATFDGIFVAEEALLRDVMAVAPDTQRIVAWCQDESAAPVTSVRLDMAAAGRRLLASLLGTGTVVPEMFQVHLNIL